MENRSSDSLARFGPIERIALSQRRIGLKHRSPELEHGLAFGLDHVRRNAHGHTFARIEPDLVLQGAVASIRPHGGRRNGGIRQAEVGRLFKKQDVAEVVNQLGAPRSA